MTIKGMEKAYYARGNRIIELEAALRVVSKHIEDTAHEDMPGKDAMQDFITKVLERGE